MKRTVCLSVCLLLLAALCACARSPAMDLSGFLQSRRELGAPLDLTRLYRTESGAGEQFWLPLGDALSLRLFAAASGTLYEGRVLLRTMTADGAALPVTAAARDKFRRECAFTLRAFCGVSEEEADRLLRALSVSDAAADAAGTLTTQSGPFALSLQAHPLELAFSVRDTRLLALPTAAVPESSPLFGETVATRRETVPHK